MAEESTAIEISDADFEEKIVKGKEIAVVDCYATWCGPCRMLSPIIDELAGEYKGKINVYKLDVDKNPKTAEKFSVMSIPTVLYFKDGEKVNQTQGAMPIGMLKGHFDKLVG
jgi:thioredoxin 1